MSIRPKLASRLIAAAIAALIAGFVSGPVDIQAASGPGGTMGASIVPNRPVLLPPTMTADPSPAVPNQNVVLIGLGFSAGLSREVPATAVGIKSSELGPV